jgi:hypothetical protein
VTPIDDDLEKVVGAQRRLERREEVLTPERLTGDDAQASMLNCHQIFRVTKL